MVFCRDAGNLVRVLGDAEVAGWEERSTYNVMGEIEHAFSEL